MLAKYTPKANFVCVSLYNELFSSYASLSLSFFFFLGGGGIIVFLQTAK